MNVGTNANFKVVKELLNNVGVEFQEAYHPKVVKDVPGFHALVTVNNYVYFPDDSLKIIIGKRYYEGG